MNVVLGYSAWRDQFGSDRSVIGREVRVNGEPGTVLGVMPEGFAFPDRSEVWVPFRDDPLVTARGQGRFATVYGRLKDGVTRDQAQLEFAAIADQLAQEYPETNEAIGSRLETPIEANMDSELNLVFGAMMIAVLFVLLVACANVASLLLARAAMKSREAGIRVAMGGSRLRVMLPFLAEALVLAAFGAVLGIGIAYVGVDWFDTVTDPSRTGRPWFMQFKVDWPILGFVMGLTVLTALAAGVAPAWKMSKTDVNSVLKDESRGSSGLQVGRISRILVIAEVALSCALLVGAGLMTKSMVNIGQVDYPYLTDGLFTARVGLFEADYPEVADRQRFWTDLRNELQISPQISAAALTTALPQNGPNRGGIAIDGSEFAEDRDLPRVNWAMVSPGYFEALGSEVLSGRDFVDQDDVASERVAIVNQPMVDRHFGGQNPIGRRFRAGASDTLPLITVVGVAPDLDFQSAQNTMAPEFDPSGYYVPLAQHDAQFVSIAAQPNAGEAMALTGDIRTAVRRVDPDIPIYYAFSQAEVIDRAIWFYGVFGTVFVVFGLAALFMASVGLYGVLSFAVTRRTQEMGIRMALGAGSQQVIGLVARQGATQLGVGLAIGLALAFGLTRLIGLMMYNVDPQDPVVFAGVLGVITVVGMAAAVFPARRATSVDPVEALR
jgi:predicted permease